jgi:hypothetical protein
MEFCFLGYGCGIGGKLFVRIIGTGFWVFRRGIVVVVLGHAGITAEWPYTASPTRK